MSNWNRKQKAISAICGMIGFLGGYKIAVLPNELIATAGVFIMLWGIYYFVKGTY